MTFPTYPYTNLTEAIEGFSFAADQIHRVVNEDEFTDIDAVNGPIPSLRKIEANALPTHLAAANPHQQYPRGQSGTVVGKGPWTTSVAYVIGDVVTEATVEYICLVNHTSGTFATDLTAGKWKIYQAVLTSDLSNSADSSKGSNLVGYKPPVGPGIALKGYLDRGKIYAGDNTEIQDALDYVAAESAGISQKAVFLIGGTPYAMGTTTITIPDGVSLIGEGSFVQPVIGGALPSDVNGTLIEYTGTGNAIEIRGTFAVPSYSPREDMKIGGFRLLSRSGSAAGISAHFMERFYLYDLYLDGLPGIQLEMLSCYNGTVSRSRLKGGVTHNLFFDVRAADPVFSGQMRFEHVDFWSSAGFGTYLNQAANIMAQNTFDTCHWQGNAQGFLHAGGIAPLLTDPHFENNLDYDFKSAGVNSAHLLGGFCNSPNTTAGRKSIWLAGNTGSLKGMTFSQHTVGTIVQVDGDGNEVDLCKFTKATGSTGSSIVVTGDSNRIGKQRFLNSTSGAHTCIDIQAGATRNELEQQIFESSVTSGRVTDAGTGTIYKDLIRLRSKVIALGGAADRHAFGPLGVTGYIQAVRFIYPSGTTVGTGCNVSLGESTSPGTINATKYLNETSAVSASSYTSVSKTSALASDRSIGAASLLALTVAGGATSTGDIVVEIDVLPYRIRD